MPVSFFQKILRSQAVSNVIGFAIANRQRFFVLLWGLFALYVFVVLLSYDAKDPAWSHAIQVATEQGVPVANMGGERGAFLADVLYVFFGYGAWLIFLWIALEMTALLSKNKPRIIFPVRLLSYGFLWACCVVFVASITALMEGAVIDWSGVVGHQLYVALQSLLTEVGALVFAVLGFVCIFWLLVDFSVLSEEDARPLAPLKRVLSTTNTHQPSTQKPAQDKPAKTHRGIFEHFLRYSDIGENLDRKSEDKSDKHDKSNASATNKTTPQAPATSPVKQAPRSDAPKTDTDATADKVATGTKIHAKSSLPDDTKLVEPAKKSGWIARQAGMAGKSGMGAPIGSSTTNTAGDSSSDGLTDGGRLGGMATGFSGLKRGVSDLTRVQSAPSGGLGDEAYNVHSHSKSEIAPKATPSQDGLTNLPKTDWQSTPTTESLTASDTWSASASVKRANETVSGALKEAFSGIVLGRTTSVTIQSVPSVQKASSVVEKTPMPPTDTPDILPSINQQSEKVASNASDSTFDRLAWETAEPAPWVEDVLIEDQGKSYHDVQNTTAQVNDNDEVAKPDIHDDQTYQNKSFAMQMAAYRASLPPIPSLDLLDPKPIQNFGYSQAELQQLAELLEIKLKEFGVNATVMDVVQGPIVTSFEVQLAAGVKASKVTGIAQDLARSLSMMSLRVVEVIAGKPYIGIEIPNHTKETVKLTELLHSPEYQQGDHQIAMAMGKDIGGNVVIADLAKAPHMLVAGTTGSGKSVLVNAMLLSMLLKYTPDELRLILIDPKMLELANYGDIPHLLTPVVTDMTEAASALSWCVGEMERRYQLMALLKVRKISEFNKKVKEAENRGEPLLDPLWRKHDSVSQDRPPKLKPLPLIVVVADEFADMIMQVGKQAEELITRLAQKSRAAGIHLMLATQRPSVDVITGLIKANIPSRAALRVNSKVDSRTILDAGGAEDMLGHGDMLFLAPGKNEPIRVHGAYVTDEEVNRVTDAWRERGAPDYIDTVTSSTEYFETPKGDDMDALYDEALTFVMDSGKTSISAVQRRLSIGYNRAANIIEQLERQGVLSKPDNSGKRTLLL